MRKNYEKPVAELVGFQEDGSIETTVDCGRIPEWVVNPFNPDCGTPVYCVENTFANFAS